MVKNFHRYNTNHPVDNLCEYVLGQEPAFWITKFPSFADVLPTFYERLSLVRWIGAVHQRTPFKGLKYLVLIRAWSRSRDQELELFSCINNKYCRRIHPPGFEQVEILRQIYQVSEVYARRLTTLSSEVTNWTAWIGRLKIVQKSTVSFRALLKLKDSFIHSFLPLTTYKYNNIQEIYNTLKIIYTILTKLFTKLNF